MTLQIQENLLRTTSNAYRDLQMLAWLPLAPSEGSFRIEAEQNGASNQIIRLSLPFLLTAYFGDGSSS